MSYDLFFEAGAGKKLDQKTFAAHFKSRPNYRLENGQAIYQNEDTGVYFIIDEPEDGLVAVNINLLRPHIFGLEAAIELDVFAKAFSASVNDPQGAMEGAFSTDAFIRGWNEANEFAYGAWAHQPDDSLHTWPSKKIREVWEWNYGREKMRQKHGKEIFTPRIFSLEINGEAQAMVIWPPDCPILLPSVDAVLVPLSQSDPDSHELALVGWDEVFSVARPYLESGAGIKRYRLSFKEWPSDVAGFLGKKRKAMGKHKGIGMDEILDRETMEAAKG